MALSVVSYRLKRIITLFNQQLQHHWRCAETLATFVNFNHPKRRDSVYTLIDTLIYTIIEVEGTVRFCDVA